MKNNNPEWRNCSNEDCENRFESVHPQDFIMYCEDCQVYYKLDLQEQRIKELKDELEISNMIGDSFWKARKLLNLPTVNVRDPGSDITNYISKLQAQLRTADGQARGKCLKIINSEPTERNLRKAEEIVEDHRTAKGAYIVDEIATLLDSKDAEIKKLKDELQDYVEREAGIDL